MRAVILAAGMGTRLEKYTQKIPKAAVSIRGRTLIERVIDFSCQLGVTEIVVVGGSGCEKLWDILKKYEIIPIENQHYRKGSLYSLYKAKPFLDEDFVQLNVDHLFPRSVARILTSSPEGISLLCDFDRRLFADDMKVQVIDDLSQEVKLGAISKTLATYDGGYCGAFAVRGDNALNIYHKAFQDVIEKGDAQASVEDVFRKLVEVGHPPLILDMSGNRWLEIDTPDDLSNADRILRMTPHYLEK